MPAALSKLRFTLLFLIVMLAANLAVGSLLKQPSYPWFQEDFGIGYDSLMRGEIYRLLTSIFLSRRIFMYADQVIFTLATIGVYEYICGTWRAVWMYFAINTAGLLLTLFAVIKPLALLGIGPFASVLAANDIGMSAGGFGLVGAMASFTRWPKTLLALVLLGMAIKPFLHADPIADTGHIVTFLVGFGLQKYVNRRDAQSSAQQP